jgi:hypothetical protein
LRRLKMAFDPNGVSEPAMYISAKDVSAKDQIRG